MLNERQHLEHQYKTHWLEQINGNNNDASHKLRTYCKFKNTFEIENYLRKNIPVNRRKNFSKLRISAHTLQIEAGRYTRPKTPVELRKCTICKSNSVEDESHFILDCSYYSEQRTQLFNDLSCIHSGFTQFDKPEKFNFIMTMGYGKAAVYKPILSFVNSAFEMRHEFMGH